MHLYCFRPLLVFINIYILSVSVTVAQDKPPDTTRVSRDVLTYTWKKKILYWNSILSKDKNDTSDKTPDAANVPLLDAADFADYILLKNQILPTDDARNFLLLNNPSLKNLSLVDADYPVSLPQMPVLDSTYISRFKDALSKQQAPDPDLIAAFFTKKKLLDKLARSEGWRPATWPAFNDLLYDIDNLSNIIETVDATSCGIINNYLSELLKQPTFPASVMPGRWQQLLNLINDFRDFIYPVLYGKTGWNAQCLQEISLKGAQAFLLGSAYQFIDTGINEEYPGQVRFDFVAYREKPGGGTDTTGLSRKFIVYIASNGLFKPSSPKYEALSILDVSTVPFYLPEGIFKVWAERNEKEASKPGEIDTLAAYKKAISKNKESPHFVILIKVY
jgi:hypothetical protein